MGRRESNNDRSIRQVLSARQPRQLRQASTPTDIFKTALGATILTTALFVMGDAPALMARQGPPPPPPNELIVNTTLDPGEGSCEQPPLGDCTLREAINAANLPGADTIKFNIPMADAGYNGSWWTIRLMGTALPMLVDDGTTIDGFSQPGDLGTINSAQPGVTTTTFACGTLSFHQPNIAIDANKAFAPSVTFPGNPGDVLSIAGDADNILITGMSVYDGYGDAGFSIGNAIAAHAGDGRNRDVVSMFLGVLPNAAQPPAAERNFGFGLTQYSLTDGSAVGYLDIEDNYVGHNGLGGINGQDPFSVITVLRNEAFENGWFSTSHDGIDLNGIFSTARCNLAHDNKVLGLPNGGGGNGIEIGSTAGDANLDNNVVEFNSAYRNVASAGIAIRKGARGNLIQKNVVFENLVGIDVNREGRTPTNRNQIFTNSTFRNTGMGIDLQGAELIPDPVTGSRADATAWFIAPDGPTPNDHCDVDGGDDGSPTNDRSNDLQNKPVLTSATVVDSQIFIAGSLDSTPLRDYVIQFFATPAGENYEGQYFLGQIVVSTAPAPDCTATFNRAFVLSGPVADGDIITATATRQFNEPGLIDGQPEAPSPAADWWSTSEYSDGVPANQVLPEGKVTGGGYIQPVNPVCESPCVGTADTRANYGFVAQYKPRGDTPEGHINFVWNPGKLHFSSKDYVFLLVNRMPDGTGDARWQGEGKLNNQPGYCFKANVHDRGEPAQTGDPLTTDSFRIKIWQKADANCSAENGPTIYDNGSDVAETPVSGGNIQIHHP